MPRRMVTAMMSQTSFEILEAFVIADSKGAFAVRPDIFVANLVCHDRLKLVGRKEPEPDARDEQHQPLVHADAGLRHINHLDFVDRFPLRRLEDRQQRSHFVATWSRGREPLHSPKATEDTGPLDCGHE